MRGVSKNNNKLLVIDWIVSHTLTMTKNFASNAILRRLDNCSPQNDRKNSCRLTRGDVGKLKCKVAFTLAECATHVALSNNSRKMAFTLAEVLITLGIIGVVAALTLPSLIQEHKKHDTELRLEKFYSVINQAIIMAEADYGDKSLWINEGNDKSKRVEWFKKYLFPYMKVVKYEQLNGGTSGIMVYYLEDGSAFSSVNGGNINRDWLFFPHGQKDCQNGDRSTGVCRFWFFFNPTAGKSIGVQPWPVNNDLEKDIDNCKNSQFRYGCTAAIAENGWKIPKNYPYKVK